MDMLTKTELKKNGWTDTGIGKFLGMPDLTYPNTHYKSAAPTCLYSRERVQTVETSPEYMIWREKSKKRQIAAQKALKTKKEKIIEKVRDWDPSLQIEDDDILSSAIDHYNNINTHTGKTASKNNTISFLVRICDNYMRHVCTDYEEMLSDIYGMVGKADAYNIIREIADDKINHELLERLPFTKQEINDAIDEIASFRESY